MPKRRFAPTRQNENGREFPSRFQADARSAGRLSVLRTAAALTFFAFVPASTWSQSSIATNDIALLKQLPFEELLNVDVTTVSRRAERWVDAPSAVQVITGEEIRRSGATSLPEALRLASNLQVAQVDSRQWAISARGFNSTTADKQLVLIDGRSVYTPLFSGVFWDVQNVMLEDIDRIEVISGPGASLWGANAVNGVINVISKNSRDTQGTLISGGGGSFLNGFGTLRYGGKLGEDWYYRVYGTGFERDTALLANGRGGTNDWFQSQGGFRTDWLPAHGETITVQGDFYGGEISQPTPGYVGVNGQNLLGRWTHPLALDSDMTLQAYWDRTWRRIPGTFSEDLNTYDLDFQHRLPFGERNKFIWGAGYRLMLDRVGNSRSLAFLPADRDLQLFSTFLQNQLTLVEDKLFLTLGSRLEHNDYSGFELQPNARLAWTPVTNQTVWAAVSRAVRSPSRIDTEIFLPSSPPFFLQGGGDEFRSEKVVAYELGYRVAVLRKLEFSISTFYDDYQDIRSVEPIARAPGQFIILNGLKAETYGAEFSATWKALDWWRLRGGYTYFKKHITSDRSHDLNNGQGEGNDPQNQFLIQSMVDIPGHVEFDSVLRFVDNLDQRGPSLPSYLALDLRVAWHPTANWEIALVGQSLLDNQHPEFGAVATRQEIPRSVYGKVTWKF